jgi:membrane associated rhomboid family serine protease
MSAAREKPAHRFTLINTTLAAADAAIFVAQLVVPAIATAVPALALVPDKLVSTGSVVSILTLLSSVFLHASATHLAVNMLFALIFGPAVESRLGHARFTALYFASGVFSGFSAVAITPHSLVPIVGASGAISGLLGAYMMLCPRARIGVFPLVRARGRSAKGIPAITLILAWFGVQLIIGTLAQSFGTPIGGAAFLFGMGLGPLLTPPARTERRSRRRAEK